MLKYLSVCSGIEAATTAWHPLGWDPVGFSEIEPFPSAVLAHRFPEIQNHGDMTNFKEWNIGKGSIDILVGGTPCQSFSVAGLRRGLADPRGNLMLTYGAIAAHLRTRWIVWENVPGVLSSNGGRDFGSFLGMLAELGYGFAYRILDAQYIRVESHPRAVPQRRRRVFVVGYLGDWRRAAEVLFESESLRWNTSPSRETGQRVAPTVTVGPPFSHTGNERVEAEAMVPVAFAENSRSELRLEGGDGQVVGAINTGGGKPGQGTPAIAQPFQVGNCLTARTAKGINTTIDEGQTPVISYHTTGDGWWREGSGTLRARDQESHEHLAVQPVADTITSVFHKHHGASGGKDSLPRNHVVNGLSVRRLTPTECERLQGFPDDWTRIPWRGKDADQCPDGPRYKAIGNSMAVNVMCWIGKRISQFL